MKPARARELLDAEEQRLRELHGHERERMDESLEASTGELTAFDQHPGDMGTETHDREVDQTLLQALERGLEDVAAARHRLEAGSYGHCGVCGDPIPDERLEAQPAATHCTRHQAEQDRQQRAAGS